MNALHKERLRRIRAENQLNRIKIKNKRRIRWMRFFDSFMKVLVLIIVLHGLACVTASYIFAWHGIMEPLQSLSETIAREIVAPVVTYGATKTIENVSKYNDWLEQYLTSKTAEKAESEEE